VGGLSCPVHLFACQYRSLSAALPQSGLDRSVRSCSWYQLKIDWYKDICYQPTLRPEIWPKLALNAIVGRERRRRRDRRGGRGLSQGEEGRPLEEAGRSATSCPWEGTLLALNPAPGTLDPKSSAPNPKPQTPKSELEPYTRARRGSSSKRKLRMRLMRCGGVPRWQGRVGKGRYGVSGVSRVYDGWLNLFGGGCTSPLPSGDVTQF